jgi:subtilase family protein
MSQLHRPRRRGLLTTEARGVIGHSYAFRPVAPATRLVGTEDPPDQNDGDPLMRNLTSRTRAVTAWATLVTALLAFSPAIAGATSPPVTQQATTANAAFLAYAPAPAGPAKALCLVDSGVNATPDLAPGLLSATALDGGTGNDVDPLTHGTIDAAVAGGAGSGVLGAWPQLKIVSVRATDVPSPGQSPTFQYDDYVDGIRRCNALAAEAQVVAIDLPLSSKISPTPDQSDAFAAAANQAKAQGITILAAAGNESGVLQLPANQPGVFAVGAGDAIGAVCPLSATTGLTFFAPGCGIDQINSVGETFCCGNGTSQASAFAAGVLVALRSYAPELAPTEAVQFLLSTTRNGHLDVAAAFRAAGLGAIVDAGTAAIPKPPAVVVAAPPVPAARPVPRPSVKRVTWRRGVLVITLNTIAKRAKLHAKLTFVRGKARYVATSRPRLRVRTPLPRRVVLHLSRGALRSATVSVRVSRRR